MKNVYKGDVEGGPIRSHIRAPDLDRLLPAQAEMDTAPTILNPAFATNPPTPQSTALLDAVKACQVIVVVQHKRSYMVSFPPP